MAVAPPAPPQPAVGGDVGNRLLQLLSGAVQEPQALTGAMMDAAVLTKLGNPGKEVRKTSPLAVTGGAAADDDTPPHAGWKRFRNYSDAEKDDFCLKAHSFAPGVSAVKWWQQLLWGNNDFLPPSSAAKDFRPLVNGQAKIWRNQHHHCREKGKELPVHYTQQLTNQQCGILWHHCPLIVDCGGCARQCVKFLRAHNIR